MKKYFISIVLLCICSLAFGAGVTLSGDLKDINGNPVYSVQVTLQSKTDENVKFVVNTPQPPNYTPTYKFEALESGDYTLKAFGDGYRYDPTDITIGTENIIHHIILIQDDNVVKISVNVYQEKYYQPVPYAHIQCYIGDELKAEATTDETGGQSFYGMSPGDYKFVVTAAGFKRTETTKTISKFDCFITIRMPEELGTTVNVAGIVKKNGELYDGIIVKIKNIETDKTFYSESTLDGEYFIPNVQIGNSTFSIEVPNMTVINPLNDVNIVVGNGTFIQDIEVEQTAVSMKGCVYQLGTMIPISNASIEVKLNGDILQTVEVNYMGAWNIDNISESGEYEITASKIGYSSITKTVTIDVESAINNGDTVIIIDNFELEQMPIEIKLNGLISYYDPYIYENIKVKDAIISLFDYTGETKFGEGKSNDEGIFQIIFNGLINTNYMIRVVCDGFEDYESSKVIYSNEETISIYLTKPAAVIYPVINLDAKQGVGEVSVVITWELDPQANEYTISRYNISRKTIEDSYFGQIGVVLPNEDMTFTDTSVEVSKNYCYVVDVVYSTPSGIGYYSKDNPICITVTEPQITNRYTVTILNPEFGTLEVKNGDNIVQSGSDVEEDSILEISGTPISERYIFDYVTIDGEQIIGNKVTIKKDITISALFRDISGVNEIEKNNIKIWANERTVQINVIDHKSGMSKVEIYDICGRIIKQGSFTGNQYKISIEKAGVYVVKVDSVTQKIVIE